MLSLSFNHTHTHIYSNYFRQSWILWKELHQPPQMIGILTQKWRARVSCFGDTKNQINCWYEGGGKSHKTQNREGTTHKREGTMVCASFFSSGNTFFSVTKNRRPCIKYVWLGEKGFRLSKHGFVNHSQRMPVLHAGANKPSYVC